MAIKGAGERKCCLGCANGRGEHGCLNGNSSWSVYLDMNCFYVSDRDKFAVNNGSVYYGYLW